jgi:S1-C subfamily serine protease
MTRERRRLLPQYWPCLFGLAGLLSLWPVGPRADEGADTGYADLVARVLPSVVNISVRKAVQVADGSETRDSDQVVLGSGFIIDPSGYVVTNRHVCQSALNIDPPSASKIDPPFVVACAGSP